MSSIALFSLFFFLVIKISIISDKIGLNFKDKIGLTYYFLPILQDILRTFIFSKKKLILIKK